MTTNAKAQVNRVIVFEDLMVAEKVPTTGALSFGHDYLIRK
jgi:hypothetical protein